MLGEPYIKCLRNQVKAITSSSDKFFILLTGILMPRISFVCGFLITFINSFTALESGIFIFFGLLFVLGIRSGLFLTFIFSSGIKSGMGIGFVSNFLPLVLNFISGLTSLRKLTICFVLASIVLKDKIKSFIFILILFPLIS